MILSCPSFIIPGTYLENLEHVRDTGLADSVELLFFLFDEDTDKLLSREIEGIRELSTDLGITVHLPDDLKPEHENIIEKTSDFTRQYVVHPPPEDEDMFVETVSSWRHRHGDRFLLENLIGRDFEGLLKEFDSAADGEKTGAMPVCCDTGHLLVRGESPADFLVRYEGRVREVHLHGLDEGWDHNPFSSHEPWFLELAPLLAHFEGVVNIEVFREDHLKRVHEAMRERNLIP